MAETPRPAQYVDIGGTMWPTMVTEKTLKAIRDFDVWDDDMWIAVYPKSGTHWASEICNLIKYSGNSQHGHNPSPMEFFSGNPSQHSPTLVSEYNNVSEWESPRVIATHVPVEYLPRKILDEGKGKVLSVIRNPKDTVVSEYYFLKGVKPGAPETFSQCLVENGTSEHAPYNTWFGHVLGYWGQRHHRQFLVLKYEDMKRDTRGAVIQIADFMGRPLSDEALDKIVDLVQVDSMKTRFKTAGESQEKENKKGAKNILRKGVVGDWKTHFSVAENEAFDALYRQKMAGSGLELQFE
ncbi:sulfotransferase 2A1-like [Asterias amurensis]|uniref:sulfotransferase 2A1-like n=1 Tax=Asterias amurensis TaxID=7602 RepID=UPI003AB579DC